MTAMVKLRGAFLRLFVANMSAELICAFRMILRITVSETCSLCNQVKMYRLATLRGANYRLRTGNAGIKKRKEKCCY
jgi:hypothetical protein